MPARICAVATITQPSIAKETYDERKPDAVIDGRTGVDDWEDVEDPTQYFDDDDRQTERNRHDGDTKREHGNQCAQGSLEAVEIRPICEPFKHEHCYAEQCARDDEWVRAQVGDEFGERFRFGWGVCR